MIFLDSLGSGLYDWVRKSPFSKRSSRSIPFFRFGQRDHSDLFVARTARRKRRTLRSKGCRYHVKKILKTLEKTDWKTFYSLNKVLKIMFRKNLKSIPSKFLHLTDKQKKCYFEKNILNFSISIKILINNCKDSYIPMSMDTIKCHSKCFL